MMWVPPGFAHGFLVMSERVEFMYKCTDYYAPQSERALLWSDPAIGIKWPIPAGIEPIVSDKDKIACTLSQAECFP
jgi:dTDP-4-dehydrorhamnose 3,5-epimerase